MTPTFLLKVDGQHFPPERILRIEVTDEAGFESDELQLVMDDTPPQIARPRAGAKNELSLGFLKWAPPVYTGTYIFEEVEGNGYERTLTQIAKAAAAKVKEVRAAECELSCELVGMSKPPIKVKGVAPDADGDWIACRLIHVWDDVDRGATTTVMAEFGMDEKDDKKDRKKSKKTSKKRAVPSKRMNMFPSSIAPKSGKIYTTSKRTK